MCLCFELLVFVLSLLVSRFSDSYQPSGADPYQATVTKTVVPGADRLHPLGSAVRRLVVSVAGFGAHTPPRRALLSNVLVEL